MQINAFDMVMVYMPEYKAKHSPLRAVLVMEVADDGWLYVVPFSRTKDSLDVGITEWPAGVGGRDMNGFMVPRLHGWLHPSRVRRYLGEVDYDWEDIAVNDMRKFGPNYNVIEYGPVN